MIKNLITKINNFLNEGKIVVPKGHVHCKCCNGCGEDGIGVPCYECSGEGIIKET